MSAGNSNKSSSRPFLFVNLDGSNYKTKRHLGAVNAHVHADARAKKKEQEALRQQESVPGVQQPQDSTTTASSSPSLDAGFAPNYLRRSADYQPQDIDSGLIGKEFLSDLSQQHGDVYETEEIEGLCTSPSTLIESGPATPADVFVFENEFVQTSSSRARQFRRPKKRGRKLLMGQKGPRTSRQMVFHNALEPAISKSVVASALDPFLILPIELTDLERNFTQYYLETLGPSVYGTRPESTFCPVRDVTLPNIANDPLVLQWVIIGTEAFLAAQRGATTPPESLLRRKANAYRLMNERLNDPQQDLESTFGGMLAAVVQDSRVTGPQVASLHLRGLESVIQKRGGMEVLFEDKQVIGSAILFVWVHHLTSDAGGIPDLQHLSEYKRTFLQSIKDMQIWNRVLSEKLRNLELQKAVPHVLPRVSNLVHGLPDPQHLFELYSLSRQQCFSVTSPLRPLVDPDYPCSTHIEHTCQFSNLYSLNMSLWTFGKEYGSGTTFLNKVRHFIETNGDRDPVTGLTVLTPSYLMWILPKARMELGPGNEEAIRREVWAGWKIIQALKVRALLSEENRRKLMQVLSGWLLEDQDQDDTPALEVTDQELEAMDAEILRNWMGPVGGVA